MDIIIVILVVLNAAMIIAVAENYNDENRTYNTRWFMNLYKNDEYGRAVDYASRDKIVIDNIQDNELDESIAVAEYYNAEFYKNVYKTMGNTQKLKQMEEQSDMALKRIIRFIKLIVLVMKTHTFFFKKDNLLIKGFSFLKELIMACSNLFFVSL